jgi:hypothetical protein
LGRTANPAIARDLFVREGLSCALIAERLKVTERSVQGWKAKDKAKGDDWPKARVASKMGKESVETATQAYLEQFLAYQRDALSELQANAELTTQEKVSAITSLTDAYCKSVRACALTAPALNHLAIAMEVIQRLTAFASERHPEATKHLLAVLEPFGAELAKAYG